MSKRYAVCVGVNPDANQTIEPHGDQGYALKNAVDIQLGLITEGFELNNTPLVWGKYATTAAIRSTLQIFLVDKPEATDFAVLYFCGPLLQLKEPNGTNSDIFLVTGDFKVEKYTTNQTEWDKYPLRFEQINKLFYEPSRASRLLFVFDNYHNKPISLKNIQQSFQPSDTKLALGWQSQKRELIIQARLLRQLADLEMQVYNYGAALDLYLRAALLFRMRDQHEDRADTLYKIAEIAYQKADFDQTRKLYEEGFEVYIDRSQLDYRLEKLRLAEWKLAHAGAIKPAYEIDLNLFNRHNIITNEQDLTQANRAYLMANYNQARLLYEQAHQERVNAGATYNLACVDLRLANYNEARHGFEQALSLYTDNSLGQALAWHNLANLEQRLENFEAALYPYDQAIFLYRQINERLGEADALKAKGEATLFAERYTEAFDNYAAAYQLYKSLNQPRDIGLTLKCLGDCKALLDHYDQAIDYYQQAKEIFAKAELEAELAHVCQDLASLYNLQENPTLAIENYQQALNLYETIKSRLGQANVFLGLGKLYYQQAQLALAQTNLNAAANLYQAIGDKKGYDQAFKFSWQISNTR